MIGIDIETPELLLVDRLREKGRELIKLTIGIRLLKSPTGFLKKS